MTAAGPLFVSTALQPWQPAHPELIARDCGINGTVFRRLDPEYYAWLRFRMHIAQMAAKAGQLDASEFDRLRASFNRVHAWAMERFERAALEEAIRTLDARHYEPPQAIQDAPRRELDAGLEAQAHAAAQVDAVRERALALGWSEERLYTRGLVALLHPSEQIGTVTREAIEIILPSGVRQHFYNPDVEQPWIRRAKK
jgi:hypothetical protein